MAILPKNLFAGSRRASEAANDSEELGFGGQYGQSNRVINEDGSFNIKRQGTTGHLYYDLITQSWSSFLVRVVLTYITINLLFATAT